jgi:Ala-tRNA(Pro) deacylase
MPGAHTKNLFLKDVGGAYWLVTVPSHARVDLKALPAAIGSKRVSFGKAEDMERLLGIAPGSVTPLAAINAEPGSIAVVLDAALAIADPVNVHPLRNTATLGLSGATILDLLRHWGHQPLVASIPVQESA